MSSIHYKFKAELEYKTLSFDGLHIYSRDLKKKICEKENIKAEASDVLLINAHTKRQLADDELVPRNSSVSVQRALRTNAPKPPKVLDTTCHSGVENKPTTSEAPFSTHINSEEFDKMTEEERLDHVKKVSSYKYLPENYQKRTSSILCGPPPPTYVCNRCSQAGHWYNNCPLLNARRPTGMIKEELMETTPNDPLALLHYSGKYVTPVMHWKARHKKMTEIGPVVAEIRAVPNELKCRICSQLLKDAVLTTCCGDTFCAECVQQRLLSASSTKCAGENCISSVSADKIVPNLKMREAVEAYKKRCPSSSYDVAGVTDEENLTGQGSPTAAPRKECGASVQPVKRIRISLSDQSQLSQPATFSPPDTDMQESQIADNLLHSNTESDIVALNTPGQVGSGPTANMSLTKTISSGTPPNLNNVSAVDAGGNAVRVDMPTTRVDLPKLLPHCSRIASQDVLPRPSISEPLLHTSTSISFQSHINAPVSSNEKQVRTGRQPPAPGIMGGAQALVSAALRVKDAWDEFLERKDMDRRQAAARFKASPSPSSRSGSGSSRYSNITRSRSPSRSCDRKKRHRCSRRRQTPKYCDSKYHHGRNRDPAHEPYQLTPSYRPSLALLDHCRFAEMLTLSPHPSLFSFPASDSRSLSPYSGNGAFHTSHDPAKSHARYRCSGRQPVRMSERRSANSERLKVKKEGYDENEREVKMRSRKSVEENSSHEKLKSPQQRKSEERSGNGEEVQRRGLQKQNAEASMEGELVEKVCSEKIPGKHRFVQNSSSNLESEEKEEVTVEGNKNERKNSEMIAMQKEEKDEKKPEPVPDVGGVVSISELENPDGDEPNKVGRDQAKEKRKKRLDGEEEGRKKRRKRHKKDGSSEHKKHRREKKHKRAPEEKTKGKQAKEKRKAERKAHKRQQEGKRRAEESNAMERQANSQDIVADNVSLNVGREFESEGSPFAKDFSEEMKNMKENERVKDVIKNKLSRNISCEKRNEGNSDGGKVVEKDKSRRNEEKRKEKEERKETQGMKKQEKRSIRDVRKDEETARMATGDNTKSGRHHDGIRSRRAHRAEISVSYEQNSKERREVSEEKQKTKERPGGTKKQRNEDGCSGKNSKGASEVRHGKKRFSEADRSDHKKKRSNGESQSAELKSIKRNYQERSGKPENIGTSGHKVDFSSFKKASCSHRNSEEEATTGWKNEAHMKKVAGKKQSVNNETSDEKQIEGNRSTDILKDRRNLVAEVESDGEKVTWEAVFEDSKPHPNTRREIKVVLLPSDKCPADGKPEKSTI